MASRRIRKQLKKLLLAVPVIAGIGCGGGGGVCGGAKTVDESFAVPDASAFIDAGAFDCGAACSQLGERGPPKSCVQAVVDGGPGVDCTFDQLCLGRRPEGLLAAAGCSARTAVGALLAESARLEAAAVYAFARTARELRAHGAPRRLVARAHGAARDEVRHARSMRQHARRHAATPQPARLAGAARPVRALVDIAIENAVEGCVRETYGALVAQFQARTAGDQALRHALKAIAVDESNHAELSWDLAQWLEAQLTAGERARVRSAMNEAIAELDRDVAIEPAPETCRVAGLPNAAQAKAFVAALRADLWRSVSA